MTQFKYFETVGVKRTAYLTNAHFLSTPIFTSGTDDPQWKTILSDGTVNGPWPYLTYLGNDGRQWTVTVQAEYDKARHAIKIWPSHQTQDGSIAHADSRRFTIIDWNGKPVTLEKSEWIANDSAPGFTIV